MAKAKHHLFETFTREGREFIRIWNKGYKKGIKKKLAEKFELSIATVYRIRKKLELFDICSLEHPGRKKLIKKIKKMYLWDNVSTLRIAEILRMSSENIRKLLIKEQVPLGPKHVTNALYFPTRSGIPKSKLIKLIKNRYYDGQTAAEIAGELGIDQSSVCTKLKCMDIDLRQTHRHLKGGYQCQWCGTVMEEVWQNKGIRKQKFCSNRCGNKAKDYRRYVAGKRISKTRKKTLIQFLKKVWGNNYLKQRKILLNVKPCIR